jgi:hypothetical protein
MSFTELLPAARADQGSAAKSIVVGISCNKAGGRFQRWITLYFSPAALGLPWVAKGQTVSVGLGAGTDAGKLRISRNGAFFLKKPAGRAQRLIVRIPGLQNQSPAVQPLRAVSYMIADQSIVIDLPGWALGKTAQQPAVAQMPGAPFKLGAPSHADVLRGQGIKA